MPPVAPPAGGEVPEPRIHLQISDSERFARPWTPLSRTPPPRPHRASPGNGSARGAIDLDQGCHGRPRTRRAIAGTRAGGPHRRCLRRRFTRGDSMTGRCNRARPRRAKDGFPELGHRKFLLPLSPGWVPRHGRVLAHRPHVLGTSADVLAAKLRRRPK